MFSANWCGLLVTTIAFVVPILTDAHLCIISPHQRGPLDISHSGSHTCFRHGAPCGGQPPQEPVASFSGGSTVFIKFQQNYNHYEVGYPGYMDIALANSPSADAKFNAVGVFGDVNEHAQDNQQNYTLPIVLPQIECSHCVLRVRYVPHKPGERIFYQCSDIAIKLSQNPEARSVLGEMAAPPAKQSPEGALDSTPPFLKEKGRATNASLLYGFAWNEMKSESVLVSVDTVSGKKQKISSMAFGLGSGIQYGPPSTSSRYAMDQIACYGLAIPNYMHLLEHSSGDLDALPDKMLSIDVKTGMVIATHPLLSNKIPIISLVSYKEQICLGVQIEELQPKNSGNFSFSYGMLLSFGFLEPFWNSSNLPETNYVNYLWATLDRKSNMHYLLIGHENTPDKLKAKIHTFDILNRVVVRSPELDVSEYTISAIQVYEKTGELFAMSPGLFGVPYPAWTLVTVNQKDGTITKKYQVTPAGVFEQYYGGTVINLDQDNGVLYYVLRVANTQHNVIAAISIDTGKVKFSMLTDLRNIHNLAFVGSP